MTHRIRPALLFAAVSLCAAVTACDPPLGRSAQRPLAASPGAPTAQAPPTAPSVDTAPPPAPEAASAAPAILTSAAPAAPPCPAPLTCDYEAWDREPRPSVTEILVQKDAHRLYLVAGATVVRSYRVALGWGGMGPKKFEGDGVTPVGTYAITDRLHSKWHTFLGVSYPSLEDQRQYGQRRARGEVPPGKGIGFGIAIHGHRKDQDDGEHKKSDWTLGCIALDNPEIDEVASAVKKGTRVVIDD